MTTFTVTFAITVKDDQAAETEQTILDAVNSSPLRPISQLWSMKKSKSPVKYTGYPTSFFGGASGVSED